MAGCWWRDSWWSHYLHQPIFWMTHFEGPHTEGGWGLLRYRLYDPQRKIQSQDWHVLYISTRKQFNPTFIPSTCSSNQLVTSTAANIKYPQTAPLYDANRSMHKQLTDPVSSWFHQRYESEGVKGHCILGIKGLFERRAREPQIQYCRGPEQCFHNNALCSANLWILSEANTILSAEFVSVILS